MDPYLEQSPNEEIDSHRKEVKSIRSREKAINLEFLKVVSFELTGESIVPLNDSKEAVWFKKDNEWTNLMTLYAVPQPSKLLAVKMFGKQDECRLMTEMIGCERQSLVTRKPIPKNEEKMFRQVKELEYPAKVRQLLNSEHQRMVAEKLQTIMVAEDDSD